MSTFQRIGGPSAINVWALLIPGAIWPLIAWAGPDRDVSLGAWVAIGAIAVVKVVGGVTLASVPNTVLVALDAPKRPNV